MNNSRQKRGIAVSVALLAIAGCGRHHHPAATQPALVDPATQPATAPIVEAPLSLPETTTAPAVNAAPSTQPASVAVPGRPAAGAEREPVAPPPPSPEPLAAKPRKPFIDLSRFVPGKPSFVASLPLQQHAVDDAPVPMANYARQPVHHLKDFNLSGELTVNEVREKFGPPAGIAGFAERWQVYRIDHGKELWLLFTHGDAGTLATADIVGAVEDGYTREQVFSLTK